MPYRTVRSRGTGVLRTPAGPTWTPRTTPGTATATHAAATSTPSCERERVNRPQEGDDAGQEDVGEDHEQPVREAGAAQAGGDASGQGTANPLRPRAAKVEGWRATDLPVHTALRITFSPPEIQGTAKCRYPLRALTEGLCTPAACGTPQNT